MMGGKKELQALVYFRVTPYESVGARIQSQPFRAISIRPEGLQGYLSFLLPTVCLIQNQFLSN